MSDERTESENERMDEVSLYKEESLTGDSVPWPLGFIALMPIPGNQFRR